MVLCQLWLLLCRFSKNSQLLNKFSWTPCVLNYIQIRRNVLSNGKISLTSISKVKFSLHQFHKVWDYSTPLCGDGLNCISFKSIKKYRKYRQKFIYVLHESMTVTEPIFMKFTLAWHHFARTPILNFMRTWLTVDTNIMSNMDGPTDKKTESHINHSCLLCKECPKIWLYENYCHLLHRICWYTRNRTYLENKAHQSQTQSQ